MPLRLFHREELSAPRVQFFVWLLVQDHIQSHHNLHKTNIVNCVASALCDHDDKTADHIIFSCPTTEVF
jgi:hypothetical protein